MIQSLSECRFDGWFWHVKYENTDPLKRNLRQFKLLQISVLDYFWRGKQVIGIESSDVLVIFFIRPRCFEPDKRITFAAPLT
jgi:hypothetical protein